MHEFAGVETCHPLFTYNTIKEHHKYEKLMLESLDHIK